MAVLREMIKSSSVCKNTRNNKKIISKDDDSLYIKNYDKIVSLQKEIKQHLKQAHKICQDAIKFTKETKFGCKGDWDDLNACDEWIDYFSELLSELYDIRLHA